MNKAAANIVFVKWLLVPIFSAKTAIELHQVSEAAEYKMQPLRKHPSRSTLRALTH